MVPLNNGDSSLLFIIMSCVVVFVCVGVVGGGLCVGMWGFVFWDVGFCECCCCLGFCECCVVLLWDVDCVCGVWELLVVMWDVVCDLFVCGDVDVWS